ncbi:hypothetical protein GQ55_2G092400 [Panicum hallii var. hallii]|uniref:Uncharacterized protein n=1 Tax=Panicum hallii var. hallii TaxID=1504633 RepID=A0A2T7EN41_9POAL|nr:hypothetical protein GQ55_2G092400 [Panicum hallii var. hallii]PUZ69241.1 hypothetical protein GQ55_2G092400 [Panicum hallii var. hallii]
MEPCTSTGMATCPLPENGTFLTVCLGPQTDKHVLKSPPKSQLANPNRSNPPHLTSGLVPTLYAATQFWPQPHPGAAPIRRRHPFPPTPLHSGAAPIHRSASQSADSHPSRPHVRFLRIPARRRRMMVDHKMQAEEGCVGCGPQEAHGEIQKREVGFNHKIRHVKPA